MVAKYLIATFGCKVNQYESRQLVEVLEALGMKPARQGEVPHLTVVNSCAVTSAAVTKGRQAIRRFSFGGQTPVVVVGCGASAEAEALRGLDHVAAVFGHDTNVLHELRCWVLDRLAAFLNNRSEGHQLRGPDCEHAVGWPEPRDDRWMITSGVNTPKAPGLLAPSDNSTPHNITLDLPIVNTPEALMGRIHFFSGHQRAFLKVQDGCDAFCTYCIIPQLRPALRSKPMDEAVAEAVGLVRAGHKEIIVTGIFLGAYGRETAIRKRFTTRRPPLAELVRAIAHVPGLERLRLSSLEPGDVDDSLLDVLASEPACVPHLHLPLQSGSPDVLRRMNRQYSLESFLNMVDRVRSTLDRPAITTDIIVGFPGESERDFEASLEVARYSKFCKIHAFPFSPRAKTAAARWQKQFVHPAEVRERMRRLAQTELECSLAFRRQFLGAVERVIVEPIVRHDDHTESACGMKCGHADRYFEIHFDAEDVQVGDLVRVRIDRVTPGRTHGTYLPAGANSIPLAVLATN